MPVMVTLHRHNPILKERLMTQARIPGNAAGMLEKLSALSVAEFRTAGYLLAEEILPQLPAEDYWLYFLTIVPTDSRAYLGTFLKAAVAGYRNRRLPLDEQALTRFAPQATPIDRRKLLEALLPACRRTAEANMLVRVFCEDRLADAFPHLLKAATPIALWVMFRLLRATECSEEQLKHYIVLLIRQGSPATVNMADIIRRYFGMKDVPVRYSFRLENYELSRLETGEEYFMKVLTR